MHDLLSHVEKQIGGTSCSMRGMDCLTAVDFVRKEQHLFHCSLLLLCIRWVMLVRGGARLHFLFGVPFGLGPKIKE